MTNTHEDRLDLQKYADTFGPSDGLMFRQWTVEEATVLLKYTIEMVHKANSLQSQLKEVMKEREENLEIAKDRLSEMLTRDEEITSLKQQLEKSQTRVEELESVERATYQRRRTE